MIFLFLCGILICDCLLGDPRAWHPVAGIGKIISFFEKIFYGPASTHKGLLLFKGACFCICVLACVLLIGIGIVLFIGNFPIQVQFICFCILSSFLLALRSLIEHASDIAQKLKQHKYEAARLSLSRIVGRDTKNLNKREIVRASIESIAEGFVDSIASPFFYAFLAAGLGFLLQTSQVYAYTFLALLMYRSINTLDSMVGYRNETYLYFGRFSAYLDDLVNYVPSRLAVLCIAMGSYILSGVAYLRLGKSLYNAKGALQMALRDGKKSDSPNAGYPEAAFAGSLGIQLGGDNSYGGVVFPKATFGKDIYALRVRHIIRAIYLLVASTLCLFVLCILFLI